MPDPLPFDSVSPRWNLPYLFSGQAQKEVFVNEAHALVDALLHGTIEAQSDTPPPDPDEGTVWLVGGAPTGAWAGRAGQLACREQGIWLFVAPRDGLRLLDRESGQERLYRGGWLAPAAPPLPVGGATIDTEARGAIASLIASLREVGIFAEA